MAVKTIEFTYTIGSASFNTSTDVNSNEWNEMDEEDRTTTLTEAALEEINDMLEIKKDSIND